MRAALRHRPVADCLEEASDRLFSFTRLPPSQWRSARTTNVIDRLHAEFKRRIKTQTVPPSNVVLGAARLRSDQHAKLAGRRLQQSPSISSLTSP
jgi:transposase-like protein